MKTVFIYTLREPDGEVRYVGQSVNPKKRFQGHLDRARKGLSRCHKENWIRSLLARGLKPALKIEDEIPADLVEFLEPAYIQFFREAGFDLTNGNMGGNGANSPTEEIRKKIGDASRGKTISSEHKASIGRAAKGNRHAIGYKHTEEAKARIGAASKGNQYKLGTKDSQETIEKRARALRGKVRSPEAREKDRLGKIGEKNPNYGKPASEESNQKRSASLKAFYAQKRAEKEVCQKV